MDFLLRFRSNQVTTSYLEELQQERTHDKYVIILVFLVSSAFSLVDIAISTASIDDDEIVSFGDMLPIYILQSLKVIFFIAYYGLKSKNLLRNKLLEFLFASIFLGSMLTVWNVQLQVDPPRAYIVGLEAAWTLLYIDTVVRAWQLKIPLISSIMIFGFIKTLSKDENIGLSTTQVILQFLFVSMILYFKERRKRSDFMRSFSLQRREKALTAILDNIPENIAILNMDGEIIQYNQHLDTSFNVGAKSSAANIFLNFFDIKPRERNIEHLSAMSKSMGLNKPAVKKIFLRKPNRSHTTSGTPLFVKQNIKPASKEEQQPRSLAKLDATPQKGGGSGQSGVLGSHSSTSLTDLMIMVEQYHTLQDVINFFCEKADTLRKYLHRQTNFFVFDGKYRDDENKIKSFEIKISIGTFDSDESLIVILRDTTHRDIIVTLEGNNNFKTSLLSSISHELKTPLNTNLNLLNMCIKDPTIPPEIKESFLSPAHQSGKLLLSMINDVLDYSQVLAEKFVLDIKGKYLLKSLEKLRYLTEFQAKKKGISFHISISQKLNYKIWTDHRRLRQILTNLLNNAIKFTNKGFIKMRVEPHGDQNQFVKFSVSDSGIGINSIDLDRMTSILKNGTVNQKLTTKSAELGMGLLISNLLVKKLCSDNAALSGINVSSKAEEGSKFWFLVENKEPLPNNNNSPSNVVAPSISNADVPEIKVIDNGGLHSAQTLFPRSGTHEEKKTTILRASSNNTKTKKTLLDFPGSSNISSQSHYPSQSETVDKTVLAEEDEVDDRIACMIKDDNLRIDVNSTKIFREELVFHRGLSKQLSTQYSRYASGFGGLTPQKIGRKNSPQTQGFQEVPQIMLNMNPLTNSEIPFEEEGFCECPEVLVVDDDVFNLFTMENMIKSFRLQLIQAKNGEEAIAAVTKRVTYKCSESCRSFKIIFMDLSMPKMDGYEATTKLREMMMNKTIPYTPIVAWTAFVDRDKIDRCFEVGMEGYIPKPVPVGKLIETLKKFDIEVPSEVSNGP